MGSSAAKMARDRTPTLDRNGPDSNSPQVPSHCLGLPKKDRVSGQRLRQILEGLQLEASDLHGHRGIILPVLARTA